jgi:hypothetical protein
MKLFYHCTEAAKESENYAPSTASENIAPVWICKWVCYNSVTASKNIVLLYSPIASGNIALQQKIALLCIIKWEYCTTLQKQGSIFHYCAIASANIEYFAASSENIALLFNTSENIALLYKPSENIHHSEAACESTYCIALLGSSMWQYSTALE